MSIKELLDKSIENEFVELQALIMFLVYEKQVHTLDDDVRKLDLYFMEKHRPRMIEEITNYMKKMSIKKPAIIYEVKTTGHTLYVYAESSEQAMLCARRNGYKPESASVADESTIMLYNGKKIELRKLKEGKKIPYLLGGYK